MSTSNRKYKDSVFVDLFSEDEKAKENFLSLYNALHGTELKDTAALKNIRLDQVLYMSFYNDVSYLVNNKIIVLAEHQSTINENMPSQRLYFLVQSLLTSFCLSKNSILLGTSGIRVSSEMPFGNRWCRYKELGKKVPQAYFNTLRILFAVRRSRCAIYFQKRGGNKCC